MDAKSNAFPQPIMLSNNGDVVTGGMYFDDASGIDVRTYIATKAMAAMINAEWGNGTNRITPAAVATEAVQYANALISELNK